jgi:hypothetical protein
LAKLVNGPRSLVGKVNEKAFLGILKAILFVNTQAEIEGVEPLKSKWIFAIFVYASHPSIIIASYFCPANTGRRSVQFAPKVTCYVQPRMPFDIAEEWKCLDRIA